MAGNPAQVGLLYPKLDPTRLDLNTNGGVSIAFA